VTQPYDVNAVRENRQKTTASTWPFTLDGKTYTLPTELPRETAKSLRQLDDHDVDGLLRLLLGDSQYRRFEKHEITMQDIAALLEAYGKATGLGPGGQS
jgi:hypothetical protein